jgi:2-phosphoglycerate kinase
VPVNPVVAASDSSTSTGRPTVVLLAGASGVGKTQLSYRLARNLYAALVEVDDLVVAAQALTTPQTHPALHHWLQHDSREMTTSEIVDGQISFAGAMQPALRAVIDNHLETETPVVIEGDYIVPGAFAHPAVRTALVVEDDLDQLVTNYRLREPDLGDQRIRAEASLAYGRWLAEQAGASGVPVVPARPWSTAFERLTAALDAEPECGRITP